MGYSGSFNSNITTMRKSLNHASYLLDQYSLVIIMKIQTIHKAMANIKVEKNLKLLTKEKMHDLVVN